MSSDDASSRFPFISLEKALTKAQAMYNGDRSGKAMAVATAFELWGYSSKSSGGFQTISALKHYGLLEDEGSKEDRKVKLTEAAKRYFLDEREDVRASALAKFAIAPPLFNALWHIDRWSQGIPADTVARSHLKLERKLNDQSSRALLSILKENIEFAGLNGCAPNNVDVESVAPSKGEAKAPETERVAEMTPDKPIAVPQPQPQTATHPFAKPILFDMESVTVNARFDNADDLKDFIEKLQKLAPLMPSKH